MLTDDLIYLRKLEASDLEQTWRWMRDPGVHLKIGVHVPISRSAQLRWFDQADQAVDKVIFAICLRKGDLHVGNVSLDNIEERHRTARLSIFLGEPAQRGQSIGSRAIRLAATFAFGFLNLNRIWCKTQAGDEQVERFYERLGFKREGILRQHEFIEGRYVDKLVLGLLRQEFTL